MKIKLDENLPEQLLNELLSMGHDVDTVLEERIEGCDDKVVWREAQKAKRFFVTQDLDFSDIRKFKPGTHHGILVVRLKQPGRLALVAHVSFAFLNYDVETWKSGFIVLTERKIRIRLS